MRNVLITAALGAALVLTPPGVAAADPNCTPATVRLASATYEDGGLYLVGTPAGGGEPIRLIGMLDAYHQSEGFGDPPPESIKDWDHTLEWLNTPSDPNSPNWYGEGKGRVFGLYRLNTLGAGAPANSLVVTYGPNDEHPKACLMSSIQPVAP